MDNSQQTVLFIVTKSVWGGAQKYVFDLASRLSLRGFRVGVAAGGKETLYEKLRAQNIPYREMRYFQRDIALFKEIAAGIEMTRLLLKIRPRVIHASSPKAAGIAGTAALFCSFLTLFQYNPVMVMTVHGWTFHEIRPAWQRFFIRFLSRLTSLLYHRVIVISRADYHAALRSHVAPAHKLALIPHGIDASDYLFLSRNEARATLPKQISDALFLVGSIGEWTANKNYAALIEAAKIVTEKNPDARFVLFGWGEQRQLLDDLIQAHNLTRHIFLIESVNDAARYLKAFDVFVLPSVKEGLPYVLLEAQCAGVPIVATAVGGVPDIVNETNGILVPIEGTRVPSIRPDLLAEAIVKSHHSSSPSSVRSLEEMVTDTLRCYE